MKSSQKKIIILLLFLLSLGLIISGIFLLRKNPQKEKEKKPQKTHEEKNSKRDLVLERCYEGVCIEVITILHDSDKEGGKLQFNVKNKNEVEVAAGSLQMTFDNGVTKIFYYPNLAPNASAEVIQQYPQEELKAIKDYQLSPIAEVTQ